MIVLNIHERDFEKHYTQTGMSVPPEIKYILCEAKFEEQCTSETGVWTRREVKPPKPPFGKGGRK